MTVGVNNVGVGQPLDLVDNGPSSLKLACRVG